MNTSVTAPRNHQRSLGSMRQNHQRSLAMTQPAALGMTQPRTRNPATSPSPRSSPHLRPHPQRHPSRPRPRPRKHATPAPSRYHMTPTLPSRATARRPHRATPIVPHPCTTATEQRPTAPRPRAISRNRNEARSKGGRIWNHGILGGRSGEG